MKGYLASLLLLFAWADAKITSAPLVGHIQVLQELKQRIAADIKKVSVVRTEKIPTLAYLKAAPKLLTASQQLELATRQQLYKPLVGMIIQKEKELCDQYYVFYHGQKAIFRAFQDFLKELYSLVNINKPLPEFEFMRLWYEAEKELEVNSFIDNEEGANGAMHAWFDSRSDLMKNMMCVNLSLFGNMWWDGENSFYYFMNSHSAYINDVLIKDLFTKLLNHFGLDQKFVSDLVNLNYLIGTSEGNLMQVFVPKDKVDEYVYLSIWSGTPYRDKLDASIYDGVRQRHTKISPLLDQYIKDPSTMGDFDKFQARILLSQNCMLNPESGVKIFRYTTVQDNAMKEYKQAVKDLAATVFSDAVSSGTFKNIKNTKLEKLISYVGKAGRV